MQENKERRKFLVVRRNSTYIFKIFTSGKEIQYFSLYTFTQKFDGFYSYCSLCTLTGDVFLSLG